jgi:predicted transposase YdaD
MPLYVEEMPFYEEALEKGVSRGLQRGREEGREQGRAQGREQGREQGEAHALARILGLRFPEFGAPESDRINVLDRVGLDRLTELALSFDTITELRSWLDTA